MEKSTGKLRKKTGIGQPCILLVFIATLGFFSVLLLPDYWYFWLLIVVAGMALLVAWHAENFAYICPKCGAVFEISALKDFLGPNSITKKYLKCPKCKKRAWAEILRIKE